MDGYKKQAYNGLMEFEKTIYGISIAPLSDNQYYIKSDNATITLKGLEYLAENSMMRKVADIFKKGTSITIQTVAEAAAGKIIK